MKDFKFEIGQWVKFKDNERRFKIEDRVMASNLGGESYMDENYVFHSVDLIELDNPQDLKNVICPQCKEGFVLCWDDYGDNRQTLIMRGCPSGGIYDVSIHCPHCDYEEEL